MNLFSFPHSFRLRIELGSKMAGSWRCVISDRFEICGKPPPSHSAARPLRGWGLAVLGRNTPCLRMSVLRPKTAKPPLVRHAVWTRERHDFGMLEIRICVCSVEENSHQSWSLLLGPRGCRPLPANRRCATSIVIPAPARGRLRCPPREGVDSAGLLAGVPQPPTGSPRIHPSGLTRP